MRIFLPLILYSTCLFSLPLHNPAEAFLLQNGVVCTPGPIDYCDPWNSMSLCIGFTSWHVREHHMLARLETTQDNVRDFSYKTNAGYICLNMCNYLEAFAAIGGTNFSVEFPAKVLGKPNSSAKLTVTTDTQYSLNVGGNWTALQYDNWLIGFEVEYFKAKPRIISEETTQLNRVNFDYIEWQLGGGIAYPIWITPASSLVPYLGLHYSRSYFGAQRHQFQDADGDTLTFVTMRALRHVGYSFGLTLVGCEKIQLTAEATFISETAFFFNSSFRF